MREHRDMEDVEDEDDLPDDNCLPSTSTVSTSSSLEQNLVPTGSLPNDPTDEEMNVDSKFINEVNAALLKYHGKTSTLLMPFVSQITDSVMKTQRILKKRHTGPSTPIVILVMLMRFRWGLSYYITNFITSVYCTQDMLVSHILQVCFSLFQCFLIFIFYFIFFFYIDLGP